MLLNCFFHIFVYNFFLDGYYVFPGKKQLALLVAVCMRVMAAEHTMSTHIDTH